MQTNITTLLLGIQDVEVTGASEERRLISIDCKPVHDRICPHCGSTHAWVHDHREQVLRGAPMRRKHVLLLIEKTRYASKALQVYRKLTLKTQHHGILLKSTYLLPLLSLCF
ncbi:transposase family protein [Aedoeadaptatus pacaensis]|uniref:transposase family protein n=1 Tax=Aedoeadaptatus pacaensis TaxID=1776390 RepID=UPI0014304DAA